MTSNQRTNIERLLKSNAVPTFHRRWLEQRLQAGVSLAVAEAERVQRLANEYLRKAVQ